MVDRHSTLELVEHDGRSTLELVRHDETARAPERDNDATAFELDAGCLAPEVCGKICWQKFGSDHGHRLCLAQHRSCTTEIRCLKSTAVSKSPQSSLPDGMPPSLW